MFLKTKYNSPHTKNTNAFFDVGHFIKCCKVRMNLHKYNYGLYISLTIGVCILIAFWATSVNKNAVVYNEYSARVTHVSDQDVYTIGFSDKMKHCIAPIQYLNYNNIQCLSDDGLVMDLDISIQISYNNKSLIPVMWYFYASSCELYKTDILKNASPFQSILEIYFKNVQHRKTRFSYADYHIFNNVINNVIYDAVLTGCSDFYSYDYYTSRQLVENRIYTQLNEYINKSDIQINLHLFQLKNIDFGKSTSGH